MAFLIQGLHLGKQGVKASILLLGWAMVCIVRVTVFVVFAAGKTLPRVQGRLKASPRRVVMVAWNLGLFRSG